LLRVLAEHNLVEASEGRVAVGWLVVEDIITVLVLVLLPSLAAPVGDGSSVWATAGWAVLKLTMLSILVAFVGTRYVPRLLLRVARLRSAELFTLTVLVIALGVATVGYKFFGASMALGAFLAGMVVGQSKVSHQAAADALPMRDAFAVLFFVSVGMLFDARAVLHEPWLVVAHWADGRGRTRADRRVFVHSRRTRNVAENFAGHRPPRDCRRRSHLYQH
jgi:CPA2 family monovalent cation:H+ antiporter-2